MARFRLPISVSILLVFVLLVMAISSRLVNSAPGTNEAIRIYPARPTFSQPFFVTVSGQWANSCVPSFHSLDVALGTLRLETRTPGAFVPCSNTPTAWGLSVLVPPQEPYSNTAYLSVVSGITGEVLALTRHDFDVIGGIQNIPALLLVGEDVALRLADVSPDGCVPRYVSHGIQGADVTVEAQIPDLICGQTPTPWQIDVAVGPLAAGEHQTKLFATDYRQTPPRRTQLMNGTFLVSEKIYNIYFPLWGCFGLDTSPQGCMVLQSPERGGRQP